MSIEIIDDKKDQLHLALMQHLVTAYASSTDDDEAARLMSMIQEVYDRLMGKGVEAVTIPAQASL